MSASAWFTMELGAAVRGGARRAIEKAAWERGLDIEVQESKGLFESVYKFTVRGDADTIRGFMRDIEAWGKANFG